MILKPVGYAALLYACWLGMSALHETGHVLHAVVSGGAVDRVLLPLLGFSQTFFRRNPHPLFVAWGGAVWGCLLPLLLWIACDRAPGVVRRSVQFFAGFCLVANGAYLGVGWASRTGDAGDLMRYGTPAWVLVAFGSIAFAVGLYLWHRLGAVAERPAQLRRGGRE